MEFFKKSRNKNNKKSKGSGSNTKGKTGKKKFAKSSSKNKPSESSPIERTKVEKKEIIRNLISLKKLVVQPKEVDPDNRVEEVRSRIQKDGVIPETIKAERWATNIHCPKCDSTKIIILEEKFGEYNKYKCENCENIFNDDSEAPFDGSKIPIQTWIECWYLWGLTNSMEYIASKLGLELHTIQAMILQLQKVFKVNQPLTKYASEDNSQESFYLKEIVKQIKQNLEQLLGKPALSQKPADTAEERRQQKRKLDAVNNSNRARTGRNKPKLF